MDSPVPKVNVAADSSAPHYQSGEYCQQVAQLTISLTDLPVEITVDKSPTFEQLELAAQFSPILGEGEHLFSPEELAKVVT